MKRYYHGVQEYVDEIYNKLYPREKVAVDAIKSRGYFIKYDLLKAGLSPDQGPRAIKDLKDRGIPIQRMSRMRVPQARNPITRYTYGSPKELHPEWSEGRTWMPTHLKERLIRKNGNRCAFCGQVLSDTQLQVDHKLPVKYFGELTKTERRNLDNYQLLCADCNRKKAQAVDEGCSKTCYKTDDMSIIKSCYWYDPNNYTHVCMKPVRQSVIVWKGEHQVATYDKLKSLAASKGLSMQDLIKKIVEEEVK